ncbi:MAG: tetratricopeptide repeat protein [Cellvibrionaceae bacterium]|nr:tetratricopeptide repeat protein [Cellvibrionaceae bacterium]
MKRFYLRGFCLIASLTLVACGSNEPKTLATLSDENAVYRRDADIDITPLSHQQVREEYKALLHVFTEDQLKEKIERRIADVHMMEGVFEQNTAATSPGYYDQAKKAYLAILEKYPDSPDNDEVLYQLSKAYDNEGDQAAALAMLSRLTRQYPRYSNIAEAYFRKGDIHYSFEQYAEAEAAYQSVIASAYEKYTLNAHYMLAWSHYKQFDYHQAIDAFAFVLNRLLGDSSDVSAVPKRYQSLVTDTLDSISLSLDKIGGADNIKAVKHVAGKNYAWLVYHNLGQYYLSKELYEASASTYRLFIDRYEYYDKTPDMHVSMIDTYKTGGFIRQALLEKEHYVSAYGLGSAYNRLRPRMHADVRRTLKAYLDELAGHFHSQAQLFQNELAESQRKDELLRDLKAEEKLAVATMNAFDKAIDFYEKFIATFAEDERIDEIYFLRAEALFAAHRYPEAAKDYERVAYKPLGVSARQQANNAGYAAIIAYQNHIDVLRQGSTFAGRPPQQALTDGDAQIRVWQQRTVSSMLMFAEKFYEDARSPSVLTRAAEYLFSLNQYQRAIDVSIQLLASNDQLGAQLKKTAYGIIAHSYFNLADFQNAQDYYIQQRALIAPDSDDYAQVSDRLAVAIYKKAGVLIASDQQLAAIEQLLTIKQLAPQSSIRATAQYDAAILLLDFSRWSEAIAELQALQTQYPDHELAVEFSRKLAFAYEKNEDWADAADAYSALVEADPDVAIRQESLLLAGMMFEKNKDYKASVAQLRRYVDDYPQPFNDYVEAHYHLALNYDRLEDQENKNTWLKKIIAIDRHGGHLRTDRSRWLAAWANIEYGDYLAAAFRQAQLSQPLAASIGIKNQWLEDASNHYQLAADYGFFDFVTMSSYKIASLYRLFASELRAVPAPTELSQDEKQIYRTIIEEQAAPFDQLARDLHQANIDHAWEGKYNEWLGKSFIEMQALSPERYDKHELIVSYGDGIR